jgi:hypothetical protein
MGNSRRTYAPHIDAHQKNMMAMMVSLQRRLQTGSDDDRERRFFSRTLQYLTTASGRQVELEEWMVTSYEVEFGLEVGLGGLYVFFAPLRSYGNVYAYCGCLPVVMCSKAVGTELR